MAGIGDNNEVRQEQHPTMVDQRALAIRSSDAEMTSRAQVVNCDVCNLICLALSLCAVYERVGPDVSYSNDARNIVRWEYIMEIRKQFVKLGTKENAL